MDNKTCDVKTCKASMLTAEATIIRIGNKEYDLCKDCAAIFFKWLEETFIEGRDIPLTVPWIVTCPSKDSTGNAPWWSDTFTSPYPITWVATNSQDMSSNWLSCSMSYNEENKGQE